MLKTERGQGRRIPSDSPLENRGTGQQWLHTPVVGRSRPHNEPPRPTQGGADGNTHIPSRPIRSPGSHQGFFPLCPQIFYSRKSCCKKLPCNISRVILLWPRQKYCRNNLAQGKMSVVSWLEHRDRGQELWVPIPVLPLNHVESLASHFVLEPVSNFPLE